MKDYVYTIKSKIIERVRRVVKLRQADGEKIDMKSWIENACKKELEKIEDAEKEGRF